MLQPKKTKYRKAFKGKIHGNAKGGTTLNFGSYGLKAMEPERITARQIEAARRAIPRHIKRQGRLWIRVFPDGDSARFRKQAGQVTGEISEPPGLRAARALADRSAVMGIPISIVEPPVNGDYLDVLRAALDAGG